jgi:alkylhydroperoxidase/carboxymuconolactone decarboxylase family protein YurZ
MKPMFEGLETETQLLVSVGAAVAAGCIPCLENIAAMAKSEGIDPKKLKVAAIIGQFIKDQPAAHMKEAADRLLGTHLQSARVGTGCPMDAGAQPASAPAEPHTSCGCR